ncbi:MAG: hypothetical protein PUP92_36565 [Rhizonema sp. PD38]|nr:hypothetical protein [Rhizonema sp. PD38]
MLLCNLVLKRDIGISIITYGELLYMTEKSEQQAQNLAAVQAFLIGFDLYFIDEETDKRRLENELKSRCMAVPRDIQRMESR